MSLFDLLVSDPWLWGIRLVGMTRIDGYQPQLASMYFCRIYSTNSSNNTGPANARKLNTRIRFRLAVQSKQKEHDISENEMNEIDSQLTCTIHIIIPQIVWYGSGEFQNVTPLIFVDHSIFWLLQELSKIRIHMPHFAQQQL